MNYDSNPVKLTYSDDELLNRISLIMKERGKQPGITFVNLCYQILQIALQEHRVPEPETTYTSNELAPEDQIRVSHMLWELIWARKVFLLFGRSDLLGLSNGEDRFVSC